MLGEPDGLHDSGNEVCYALGSLLRNSVSSRFTDYDPVDEEVSEASIREMIREHGFEPIGEGLGRAVYRVPSVYHRYDRDLVVKFARPAADALGDSRTGTEQNLTETRLYDDVEGTEYEDVFAEIVDGDDDGLYVVMFEYDTDSADESDVDAVEQELDDAPQNPELDEHEVGIDKDGTPVVVDYGILNDRW